MLQPLNRGLQTRVATQDFNENGTDRMNQRYMICFIEPTKIPENMQNQGYIALSTESAYSFQKKEKSSRPKQKRTGAISIHNMQDKKTSSRARSSESYNHVAVLTRSPSSNPPSFYPNHGQVNNPKCLPVPKM
jgi:hypothetical protein